MDSFTESQPWPGSLRRGACDQVRPLGENVHVQKGCGGELILGPVQNQVMNLPRKCHLKLAGVIEAILIAGVYLSSLGTAAVGLPAFVSFGPEPQGLLFVSWSKLSMYLSS